MENFVVMQEATAMIVHDEREPEFFNVQIDTDFGKRYMNRWGGSLKACQKLLKKLAGKAMDDMNMEHWHLGEPIYGSQYHSQQGDWHLMDDEELARFGF